MGAERIDRGALLLEQWRQHDEGRGDDHPAGPGGWQDPGVVFEGRYEITSAGFDVTRDGHRFLMLLTTEAQGLNQISVVLNWFEELKRRAAPGKK